MLTTLGSILAFVLIFGLLVLIHEFGHFIVARWCGVKVLEFGIGLPPKAKVIAKRGDTEYTLNYLPLGGFVRLHGEQDVTGKLQKDPTSFSSQPIWKRMCIAAAGVTMNILLAFVIILGMMWTGLRPLSVVPEEIFPFESGTSYLITTPAALAENGQIAINPAWNPTMPPIAEVLPGSQAETAGILPGSHITALNGAEITDFGVFFEAFTTAEVGSEHTITIQLPDSTQQTISLTKTEEPYGIQFGAAPKYLSQNGEELGLIADIAPYQIPWWDAPRQAAVETMTLTAYTFEGLGLFARSIVSSFSIPEEIGGPVQIAHIVHQVNTMAGPYALMLLAVLLSINLAVINILPIPALDGGRILFMLYELLGGKISEAAEARIHMIGYGLLLMLLIAVTAQDIIRLL